MTAKSGSALIAAAASIGALALPAAAPAAERFVTENPANPANSECTQADPCGLDHAIESVALDGDTVLVGPGTYSPVGDATEQGGAGKAIDVEAADPAEPPVVEQSGDTWVIFNGTLSDFEFGGDGGGAYGNFALNVGPGSSASRIVIDTDATAVQNAGGTVADSILVGTSGGVYTNGGATSQLRNVTAIATGPETFAHGVRLIEGEVELRNVIARGGPSGFDLFTDDAGVGSEFESVNSNYADTAKAGSGPATFASSVNDQTSAAQTADEQIFRDYAGGDYRQRAGSPTIDAGASDPGDGPRDFEGDPRSVGAAIDIGGDEFVPAPTPPDPQPGGQPGGGQPGGGDPGDGGAPLPPRDIDPPQTFLEKRPKRITTKRRARFRFGSDEVATFECKLGRRKLRPCRSTFLAKVKPGEHLLRVRAVDEAGNWDPTPLRIRWKYERE
jgi:hypothetical protein